MRGHSPFYIPKMPSGCSSCISCRFQPLSTTYGQIAHVLLTRSPLGHLEQALLDLVRLACIRHAASVHPEPGSNSPFAHLFLNARAFGFFVCVAYSFSELTFPVQFSKIDFLASRLLRSALVYITILSLFRQAFFCSFLPFFVFFLHHAAKDICSHEKNALSSRTSYLLFLRRGNIGPGLIFAVQRIQSFRIMTKQRIAADHI